MNTVYCLTVGESNKVQGMFTMASTSAEWVLSSLETMWDSADIQ